MLWILYWYCFSDNELVWVPSLKNIFVVQFSVTPSCNSQGFRRGSEADAKVLLTGHVGLAGTVSLWEHIVVLFDSPLGERVQTPMDI